jgi:hypothetical protein
MWSWVSSFTQLQYLHLGSTNRNGNMASIDLTKSATTMTRLSLYFNDFQTGPVPSWVSSFTQLQYLNLGGTNRNGDMALMDLTKSTTTMTHLILGGNKFEAGPVPPWVSSFTRLEDLKLSGTNRNGDLALLNLTKSVTTMTHLILEGNDFEAGPFPSWLSSFTRLQVLRLDLNSDLSLIVVRVLSELATTESARVAMATAVNSCERTLVATEKQREGLETEVATAESELDEANAELDVANAELGVANSELDVADSELGVANSKLGVANSKLGVANSELGVANSELDVVNRNLSSCISKEQLSEPPKFRSSVVIVVLAALALLLAVGVIVLVVRIRKLADKVTAAQQHVLQHDRHATLSMASNPMFQQPSPPEYLLPTIGQEAIYTQTKLAQTVSDFNEDPGASYSELDAGHVVYGSSA